MLKKRKTQAKKNAAKSHKRTVRSKLKQTAKKSGVSKKRVSLSKPAKTPAPKTSFPLIKKQKGVIRLRVPGRGPVDDFNREHSKKEVISKRQVMESNKRAWTPLEKTA
jgi:hypothetical protein